MAQYFLYALTSSNINRFSKLFPCQNQENICHNAITKDPTTPQMCRYVLNVKCLKSISLQHILMNTSRRGQDGALAPPEM